MNSVISPGDRVSVTRYRKGFYYGTYLATVINWTKGGMIKVKYDKSGSQQVVSADNVKKIADAKSVE